ncbi:MAG TPA: hypothetical protein H9824_06635 [Candidatus Bacteroides pullicola]|uniref:Transmembrane protein n=1 Tax=Candidatus Bacteroides pullicola TaxID=2838475 RepID=A0A9D1ZIL4_9BACE|nr:hypothetical protein [Candidatus Bacteroides pullicola]
MNLFLELRRHGRLADKRHPMYEKSRFTRFWMYFMAVFWAGYLIFIGTTFAFGLEDAPTEPYHILNSGLVFVLALDFLMRFPFQRTPTQEVKPYLLLPVRRNRLIDFLLIRSGLSGFNFIWLFMFLPFALLTVTKFYGLWGVLTYCAGIWLLMLLNNYWYLLCRTLLGERIWWVLLPLAVYGGLGVGMFLPEDSPVFDWFRDLGEGFITGNAPAFLGVLAAIALLWWVDSRVIRRLIYSELNKTEDTTVEVKKLSEYKFLDRYGMTGEYMRLELKLMLRNKVCRKSLISIVIVIFLFSAMISFWDVYQIRDFWVMYNYVIVSLLAFSTLMGYEGNYMDGLMTRRESLFALLRAKYVLYNLVLLLPFLLMLAGVVTGKLSLLQILGWGLFTAGVVNFGFFQLAVYNNRTVDLNAKMTSRNNAGTGLQQLASFGAFALPWVVYLPLQVFFDSTVAYWGLIVLGLAFILTSRLWIGNVYKRLMRRRYQNMEGFRDSRQR